MAPEQRETRVPAARVSQWEISRTQKPALPMPLIAVCVAALLSLACGLVASSRIREFLASECQRADAPRQVIEEFWISLERTAPIALSANIVASLFLFVYWLAAAGILYAFACLVSIDANARCLLRIAGLSFVGLLPFLAASLLVVSVMPLEIPLDPMVNVTDESSLRTAVSELGFYLKDSPPLVLAGFLRTTGLCLVHVALAAALHHSQGFRLWQAGAGSALAAVVLNSPWLLSNPWRG